MPTPFNSSQPKNTSVIDPEGATEMARLMLHDRLVTRSLGGLFPLCYSLFFLNGGSRRKRRLKGCISRC